jgi:tripartite-type tricarboxylate transporter receptor subunit TctC
MRLSRRQSLHLATSVVALLALSCVAAQAQIYPSRPVRIIVGWAAGGASDIAARLISQSLSERLGQQFIIENRQGAAGSIATESVVRAPPDGYSLLLADANATFFERLNYNFIRDMAPIAGFMRVPFVMDVTPSVPAKTVPEFITYAKANPGKINMASAGTGSVTHVYGELFKFMTGIDMVHVPYRGASPALVDLLSGQVQIYFGTVSSSIGYIRAGRLRALAVTTLNRSEALPQLPTVAEFVPGYEASFWAGIGAPRNTPVAIIDKLNRGINAALADPKMKARIADLGGTGLAGSPADFGNLIAEETEKWGKVVKFEGIKAE